MIPSRVLRINSAYDYRKMHYCVIRKGGKVLATGYNKPSSYRYKGVCYRRHAECDAILNLPKKYHRKGVLNITVIRYGFAESKPCQQCLHFIKALGIKIKNVCYSTEGVLITEKMAHIVNTHETTYWRIN